MGWTGLLPGCKACAFQSNGDQPALVEPLAQGFLLGGGEPSGQTAGRQPASKRTRRTSQSDAAFTFRVDHIISRKQRGPTPGRQSRPRRGPRNPGLEGLTPLAYPINAAMGGAAMGEVWCIPRGGIRNSSAAALPCDPHPEGPARAGGGGRKGEAGTGGGQGRGPGQPGLEVGGGFQLIGPAGGAGQTELRR